METVSVFGLNKNTSGIFVSTFHIHCECTEAQHRNILRYISSDAFTDSLIYLKLLAVIVFLVF